MWRMGRQYAFSQNLIRSPLLVKRLLDKSRILSSDTIIEIGAGKGVITYELAKRCKEVVAYEIDPNFYKFLKISLGNTANLKLINEDFLRCTLPQYPYKVIANIPFNFTSRILNKLLKSTSPPILAYLILQENAACKFIGEPRETQMSLLLKPIFQMQIIVKLKRTDFQPKPRVRTVYIEIEKRTNPYLIGEKYDEYKDFIVYATTQWQATIADSLKKIFTKEQLKRLSRDLNFNLSSVPLDLSFYHWLGLFNYYETNVDISKKTQVHGSYVRQVNTQDKLKKTYRTR